MLLLGTLTIGPFYVLFFIACFALWGYIFFCMKSDPYYFCVYFFQIFFVVFLFNTKVLYAEDRFIESFLSNVILNVLFYFLHYMADTLSLNGGTSADHSERYLEPTRRRYFIPEKHGYGWACLRAFHI